MKKLLLLCMLVVIMIAVGCGNEGTDFVIREDSAAKETPVKGEDNDYKIYLITMDKHYNNYWKAVEDGCEQAVKEIGGISYKWIGPDDRVAALQAECIDRAVDEGVDAILVAAISSTEANENLKRAEQAGVKIVYIDSAATYEAIATLMTDNEAAGKIAGEAMLKALHAAGVEAGTLGVLSVGEDTQNTNLRDKGFREALEGTNFTVAPTVYMHNDLNIIKDYVRDHSEYVGYLAANQQVTFAITEQIKDDPSVPIVIGFDTDNATLSAIDKGIIYATLQQNPQKMGHDGIEIAVKALQGIYKEKNAMIDTGVSIVTRESLR